MTSGIYGFTVDTPDPYTLATWWSQVLGHPLGEDDFPGDPVAAVVLPVGPPLLFVKTDDPKVVKNRLHLDLEPDGPREAEVERLLGIGATLVDDHRKRRRHRLGCARRPGGQRVLRVAQRRRAGSHDALLGFAV